MKLAEEENVREFVVWIDAKTMHMSITNRKGWVLLGSEDVFETTHPASKKKPIVLKYYIAVNYRLGKVGLRFYTGTTGMKADRDPSRPYLVSYPWCSLAGSLACICCSTSLIALVHLALRPRSLPGDSQSTSKPCLTAAAAKAWSLLLLLLRLLSLQSVFVINLVLCCSPCTLSRD